MAAQVKQTKHCFIDSTYRGLGHISFSTGATPFPLPCLQMGAPRLQHSIASAAPLPVLASPWVLWTCAMPLARTQSRLQCTAGIIF